MKKYRNTIVILLVAVLSLSVFYVNQAFSSSDLPDLYIKQTNGDAKLLETITLEASYEDLTFTEDIEVTKEGSHYRSDLSFFEQLDYWEKRKDTTEMRDLTDQYSSFMRGKNSNTQLYNDTKQMIYVDSNYEFSSNQGMYNFRFKIDQLNKKTEETSTFEVKIPNQGSSNYIEILDIQIIMNELRVMTLSDSMDEDGINQLHEYTVDLKKQKLVDDNSILITEKQTPQKIFYITRLTDINPTQSNPYFLYQLEKTILDEDGENVQTVNRELYAYNYKTGRSEQVKLPDDLAKLLLQDDAYYLAYDNRSLYTSTIKEENENKAVNMVKYELENQKITNKYTIPLEPNTYEHNMELYQNKMIITYRGELKQPSIKIYNFEDDKSIFDGTIEMKNKDSKVNYKDIHIYQVNGL